MLSTSIAFVTTRFSVGTVLEIAPGPGLLAIELGRFRPLKFIGLEISRTFVGIARGNARDAGVDIEFREGDVASMFFEDGSFDFLMCTSSFTGGNPQIAKGEGDAPVQAYIAAMPGWKSDVGRRLDELIMRHVPGVRKAVKWISPFYGIEDKGWFLAFHCFTKYVKVTFFRGTSLRPVPSVGSNDPEARYFHIHENDKLDEELMASWISQAANLPGWVP